MHVEAALYARVIQLIRDSHLAPEPVEGGRVAEQHLARTLEHDVPTYPVACSVYVAECPGTDPLDDLELVDTRAVFQRRSCVTVRECRMIGPPRDRAVAPYPCLRRVSGQISLRRCGAPNSLVEPSALVQGTAIASPSNVAVSRSTNVEGSRRFLTMALAPPPKVRTTESIVPSRNPAASYTSRPQSSFDGKEAAGLPPGLR